MDRLAEMVRDAPQFDRLRLFGAVVLTVAIFLVDMRQQEEWGALLRLLLALIPCIALYLLVLSVARPGEPLARWQNGVMLCGVALLLLTLLQLADLFGADGGEGSGTLFWVFGLITLKTAYIGYVVRSPIQVLLAAIAGIVSTLAFVDWAFGDLSLETTRNLLLAIALVYCAIAYRVKLQAGESSSDYVHFTVLVASLSAVLAGIVGVGTESLGGFLNSLFFQENSTFWEIVLLAVSLLAIGYTVWTGYRATAYVGLVGLIVFVSVAAIESGLWAWPLLLLLAGIAALALSISPPRAPGEKPADAPDG